MTVCIFANVPPLNNNDRLVAELVLTNMTTESRGLKSILGLGKGLFDMNVGHDFILDLGGADMQASKRAFQSLLEENPAVDEEQKRKGVAKRAPKWIQPTVENIRRTKAGFKVMVQEVMRQLRDQAKCFPSHAMLSLEGTSVTYKRLKESKTIGINELQIKIGPFFSSFFADTRNKIQFGGKVHAWLSDVDKNLKEGRMNKIQELIWLIDSSELTACQGYQTGSEEE